MASTASPNITGTIGCEPGSRSNPAAVMPARNRDAAVITRSRRSADSASRSSTVRDAATIGGATELLNR